MNFFKTYDVTALVKGDEVENEYGEIETSTEEIVLKGCLVSPVSAKDELYPRINNEQMVIRVDVQKSYSDTFLGNAVLTFEGTGTLYDALKFEVIGESGVYIPENTPGKWNRFLQAQMVGRK